MPPLWQYLSSLLSQTRPLLTPKARIADPEAFPLQTGLF
jgi:hypothetical protein